MDKACAQRKSKLKLLPSLKLLSDFASYIVACALCIDLILIWWIRRVLKEKAGKVNLNLILIHNHIVACTIVAIVKTFI